MKDLVGRREGFITVLMWLSEMFACKSALDSCLPVETFDAKFKKKLQGKTNVSLLRPSNSWIICLP